MKFENMILYKIYIFIGVVIWDIILGAKDGADFNFVFKGYIPTFRLVLVGFSVNELVFGKIFIISARVMLGAILGVLRYAE